MLKSFVLRTEELDDADIATQELTAQLQPLCKNTIGLLACYSEFVTESIVAAVDRALPFPLVGTTTIYSGCANLPGDVEHGPEYLQILVLTSDDADFSIGCTAPIDGGNNPDVFDAAMTSARAALDNEPNLLISFVPLLLDAGGDYFVEQFDRVAPGVPHFGSVVIDHKIDYSTSMVICNGEGYRDRCAFVLCKGVDAHFFHAGIPPQSLFVEKGVVTASNKNQLISVNNISVAEYLQSLGLRKDEQGSIEGINSFPFIIETEDGAGVIRVLFAVNPDGSAVGGGYFPEGAVIGVSNINEDGVLVETERVAALVAAEECACVLVFSCVGRYFSLGFAHEKEIDAVAAALNVPFSFAYAGGEICPTVSRNNGGKTTNHYHNDTCVFCVLNG